MDKKIDKKKESTHQKAIIAVDLHGVLFVARHKNMFRTFFKSKEKLKLFFALCSPFLWADVLKLMKKKAVAEEYLVGLAEKHHRLKKFVPLGIEIANQQDPNQEVIEVLKELKKNGCTLHLFSNIGGIIFEDLRKKYPVPMTLFESFSLASRENGYARKPHEKAFTTFLKTHNPHNLPVILIDDKKKNIRGAQKHGITTIFFTSPKQLRTELVKLNLIS